MELGIEALLTTHVSECFRSLIFFLSMIIHPSVILFLLFLQWTGGNVRKRNVIGLKVKFRCLLQIREDLRLSLKAKMFY